MNKTININLAGTFFHVDENAYGKLSRYLDAIRKSLSDPQGSDEIMRDIEARIAELFSEKLESSTQVVTIKELDEVIGVMGQPEDYKVDEEIFEDAPSSGRKRTRRSTTSKKLYRDIDDKFLSGVSSGLGHYLGIDSLWVRLIWIVLVLLGFGSPILIYILLWILVPAAESTAEKLQMTGEPVNISNIEKKFKEGYENVADSIKNADYDKYGKKVKSSTTSFFDTLGNVLLTLLKIFVKFLGILLIIVALSTLIGLIVGMFTLGSVDFWGTGEVADYISLVDTTNAPVWLVSLLVLFAVGIPFFVLFILGLKMLVDNLKTIGTPAKIALLVVWLASIVGLGILGIRQATETAFEGEVVTEEVLNVKAGDTLKLTMRSNENYEYSVRRSGGLEIKYDENDERVIYSNDIRLIVRSTNDSIGRMVIERSAEGKSTQEARELARAIEHDFSFDGSTLLIDGYFTTDFENKYRDQEIQFIVYLPEGTVLFADDNTYSFHRNDSYYRDILDNGDEEQYLLIQEGETKCLDCPVSIETNKVEWERDTDNETEYYKGPNGEWIKRDNAVIKIKDNDGDEVIIDTNGIEINAAKDNDTITINNNN